MVRAAPNCELGIVCTTGEGKLKWSSEIIVFRVLSTRRMVERVSSSIILVSRDARAGGNT